MTRVALGLGSNLGDRATFLRHAVCSLTSGKVPLLSDIQVSLPYRSQALLPEGAPSSWNRDYYNIGVVGETTSSVEEFFLRIKQIEKEMGRKGTERWAPREIDIDLLFWGESSFEMNIEGQELHVPHRGVYERPFALLPLVDLIPEWRPPSGEGTLQEIAQARWPDSSSVPFETQKVELFCERMDLPSLAGILNVTPDSFSDGGRFIQAGDIERQIRALLRAGAKVIDIGAESTRPGASSVSLEEEWVRLEPALSVASRLKSENEFPFLVSVDTRNGVTAQKALECGVDWVNDVEGLGDPTLLELVARSGVHTVFMHSLSVPVKPGEQIPPGCDPVDFLMEWAEGCLARFSQAGIPKQQLIFDPGVGFGKSPKQNFQILKGAKRFRELGIRTYIGHSRKSFLNQVTDRPFAERDIETVALSLELVHSGVDYLRVHDVDLHRRSFLTQNYYQKC